MGNYTFLLGVIARSDESKRLGIEMGAPLFKIREAVELQGIKVFSSNFALYGDMSRRVMDILQSFVDKTEIYSIDEAFIELPSSFDKHAAYLWALEVRTKIWKWTGIPTRVGIGPTKTLAKLANNLAKQAKDYVACIDETDTPTTFQHLPNSKVWGVGKQLERRLKRHGVYTVGQFLSRHREWVRKVLTVEGERTYQELKGRVCYPLHSGPEEPQKSLMVSRSFSKEVFSKENVLDSLVHYANIAGTKIRKRGIWANSIGVYVRSSPFKKDTYYSNFMNVNFPVPTRDTRDLIRGATQALCQIYKEGIGYKKSGILLGDLTSQSKLCQMRLDTERSDTESAEVIKKGSQQLMSALDKLNQRYGRYTVSVGTVPKKTKKWQGSRSHTSPKYTTRWTELPKV